MHFGRLAIRAVRALTRRRHETSALLARGLGNQLLGPQPEVAFRLGDADLVTPLAPALAELEAQLKTWICLAAASLRHAFATFEQTLYVDRHKRGGHDAERRQRRVAPADRRLACEDAHAAPLRQLLEGRARIRNGDELVAMPTCLFPEVLEVRERLERPAGLRRDDEHRLAQVERLLGVPDHRGVRGVEHVQLLCAERALQHLGGQRGTAHAEEDERVEPAAGSSGELDDLARALPHSLWLVEPAEPLVLVRAGPDRAVSLPDPLDQLLLRCHCHA